MDTEHIATDRILQIVTRRDVLLTESELEHVRHCAECLANFNQIVHDHIGDVDGEAEE